MSELYVENMNLLARIGIMSTLVVTVEKLSIEELDSYHSEDELKTKKMVVHYLPLFPKLLLSQRVSILKNLTFTT